MREVSPPWLCQVLFAHPGTRCVVIDIVAMEPCPFGHADLPSGTPLGLRLQCDDPTNLGVIGEWARDGRVIMIRQIQNEDARPWLQLSGDSGSSLTMKRS